MVEKSYILEEIRRLAKVQGGSPPGKKTFLRETGIGASECFGRYWARWGDALSEAGFAPNKLQEPFDAEFLILKYIMLIRELGHLPVNGELRLKRRLDATFPNEKTFDRFGTKRSQRASAILAFCKSHDGFEDVIPACALACEDDVTSIENRRDTEQVDGFVYLLKAGRHYNRSSKLGRTTRI